MDAIELLKKDHHEVTRLFQRFATARRGRGRGTIVGNICDELDAHSDIEEAIFYPAVRRADRGLAVEVDEALREHARVKEGVRALRSEVAGADSGDLDARMRALQEDVERHVTVEEGQMFPRVAEVIDEDRRATLGRELEERKRELTRGARRGRRTTPSRTRAGKRASAKRKTVRKRARAGR